jgi:hypothetical protein
MNDLTPAALSTFAAHHGVATTTLLRIAGIGKRPLARLVADRLVTRVSERVYRLAGTPRTLEQRCVELCFAHPRGFVTGPTAGMLRALRRLGSVSGIHFAVPHGHHVDVADGVRLRQTTKILPWHVERRPDGLVMASPARLAFDLSVDLTPLDHVSAVEQLISQHRLSPADLRRIGQELTHPARRGSAQFVAMLAARLDGGAAESHAEVVVGRSLVIRGVPVVAQYPVVLPGGRRIRFDLAVPMVKWAVEVDGFDDHFQLLGGTSDRRRDRKSHVAGWQVERVSPLDLVDVEGVCDELAELFRDRCRRVGVTPAEVAARHLPIIDAVRVAAEHLGAP